ncbi:tetraacyldisaccharide 4'-kinase [Nitratiruptor sp. YY08-13]|uniref:tetraacyldisaccharide 4'-kinase n=1 Tax=unclassified Nitratiruptor TaxID=2624044 RepID=UPI001914DF3D
MKSLVPFFEELFYAPSWYHWLIAILLLPFSALYCLIATIKKIFCFPARETVPLISIGNLTVGGSGKTPLLIALAKNYNSVAVVLRGYKRKSQGIVQVSKKGKILVNVEQSGDEAMLIAKSLPQATVWVASDRKKAIELAKKEGAKVTFLDDAFHTCLQKFDILIQRRPKNPFCLPSGPFRLPKLFEKFADFIAVEGRDFTRKVHIVNPTKKMVLLTAIANPQRLEPYLPQGIKKYYFPDHHFFTNEELEAIWQKEQPDSFLVTSKDLVKLEQFSYPLSLLELDIEVASQLREAIDNFIQKVSNAKEDSNCSNTS